MKVKDDRTTHHGLHFAASLLTNYVFRLFDFCIFFLSFFSFSFLFAAVIGLLLHLLAVKKTAKKVSTRQANLTME